MNVTDKYVFFYGGPFSQWYPCQFEIDGLQYNCAEQYMMAEKARLMQDHEALAKIMATDDPRLQKKIGRRIENYNDDLWAMHRFSIVVKANIEKFSQDKALKEELLFTGDRILVEASPTDTIWGIGLAVNDELCLEEKNWRGQNLLGKALMEVRDFLKS